MRRLIAFIRLGRVHFLTGGVLLHLLGVTIALYNGAEFQWSALIFGQICITSTQLMTHYANDFFDLDADRANSTPTNWSGGSRVLTENLLPARVALIAALTLAGIALLANLILSVLIRPSVLTFGLLLLGQSLAWFYSAPPIRLHSRGLGELTTMIVVPLLTPLTGFYLQSGTLSILPVLASVPLCCLQLSMMLSIEFPDAQGDKSVNKGTLVVRFGAPTAARLYTILLVLPYVLIPFLLIAGLPSAVALAVCIPLPLALWQVLRMERGDWAIPARWNALAFYSIVLLIVTSFAELFAFILLVGLQ